jgi:hypothetical protein
MAFDGFCFTQPSLLLTLRAEMKQVGRIQFPSSAVLRTSEQQDRTGHFVTSGPIVSQLERKRERERGGGELCISLTIQSFLRSAVFLSR